MYTKITDTSILNKLTRELWELPLKVDNLGRRELYFKCKVDFENGYCSCGQKLDYGWSYCPNCSDSADEAVIEAESVNGAYDIYCKRKGYTEKEKEEYRKLTIKKAKISLWVQSNIYEKLKNDK